MEAVVDELTCETVVGSSRIPVGVKCIGSSRSGATSFEAHTITDLDTSQILSKLVLKFPGTWNIRFERDARCISEVKPDARSRSKMKCVPYF